MIKEFLDARPKVSLFTRPRCFGKTLTMDMFKTFFELSEVDNPKYFKQMDDKQYITLMKNEGISKFLKIRIAFYKKHIKLKSRLDD